MARFKAVLSDIDGTLTDSEDLHRDGYLKINTDLGVEFAEGELEDGVGVALSDKYGELKDRFNEPLSYQEWADRLAAYYVLNADKITIMPGAKDFLDRADQNGLALGAVTNAQRSEGAASLARMGREGDLFAFMVAVEDVPRPKPAPDSYLLGTEKLGINPKDIVVIEDSPVGVAAAKAAGMTCIQIQHDPSLINDNADLIVPRLDDPRVAAFLEFKPEPGNTPRRPGQ
ncbi:MAG: HAD family phosphatase [Pseudomonadota bacterium]